MRKRWSSLVVVCLLAVSSVVSMTAQTTARQEQAAPSASPPGEGPSTDPPAPESPGPRRVQSDSTLGFNLYVEGKAGIGITPATDSQKLRVHNPTAAGSLVNFSDSTTGDAWNAGLTVGYSAGGHLWNKENTPLTFATNNLRRLTIKENGNVGIGTITPETLLDVGGWARPNDIIGDKANVSGDLLVGYDVKLRQSANANQGFMQWNLFYNGTGLKLFDIAKPGYEMTMNYVPGMSEDGIYFKRYPPGAGNVTGVPLMTLRGEGNVGIGTTNPSNLLTVNSGATPSRSQLAIKANELGILSGIVYAPDNVQLGFDAEYNAGWKAHHGTVAVLQKANGFMVLNGSTGNTVGALPTQNQYWAVNLSNGNTSIGNFDANAGPTPAKLYVAGDIKASGVIHAKFQDIAEWVPATESVEPGMVVIVAPRNHVSASTDAYDTRVAGVVSAQPGLVLGDAGDSKVMVATTGRVKVRVDASNGPIREGDLLVSSGIKGTAMRSEPMILNGRKFHQPGTVVGKALEPLDKGAGEILVLLSMQ